MVPVVRKCRVDLPKRQVGVLKVQLLGAPAIRLLLDDQLNDFHSRASDARNTILVQRDVFVSCLHNLSQLLRVTYKVSKNSQSIPRLSLDGLQTTGKIWLVFLRPEC